MSTDRFVLVKESFEKTAVKTEAPSARTSEYFGELVFDREKMVTAMAAARKNANAIEDVYQKALAYHEIAESLIPLRASIDGLEEIVDDKVWPLPKYRELLFIS